MFPPWGQCTVVSIEVGEGIAFCLQNRKTIYHVYKETYSSKTINAGVLMGKSSCNPGIGSSRRCWSPFPIWKRWEGENTDLRDWTSDKGPFIHLDTERSLCSPRNTKPYLLINMWLGPFPVFDDPSNRDLLNSVALRLCDWQSDRPGAFPQLWLGKIKQDPSVLVSTSAK